MHSCLFVTGMLLQDTYMFSTHFGINLPILVKKTCALSARCTDLKCLLFIFWIINVHISKLIPHPCSRRRESLSYAAVFKCLLFNGALFWWPILLNDFVPFSVLLLLCAVMLSVLIFCSIWVSFYDNCLCSYHSAVTKSILKANTHLKYKHTMLDERIVKQINRGRWCRFN